MRTGILGLRTCSKKIHLVENWRSFNPLWNSDFTPLFEMGSSALQGVIAMYGEHVEGHGCDSLAWNGNIAIERER